MSKEGTKKKQKNKKIDQSLKQEKTLRERTLHLKKEVVFLQLLEVTLALAIFNGSYLISGKLIYNDFLPLGITDSTLFIVIMSLLAVSFLAVNRYFTFRTRPFAELTAKILFSVILLNFLAIALLYFSKAFILSPYFFIITMILQCGFFIGIKRQFEGWKKRIFAKQICLVIGTKGKEEEFLRQIKRNIQAQILFVSEDKENILQYVDLVDSVYLCASLSKARKDEVLSHCVLTGKRVAVVPETYEIALQKAEITQIGDVPLFTMENFGISEVQKLIKRCCDIVLAIVGLVLTAPLMVVIAIAIQREDKGTVFYRQIRSGLHGKEFEVIKFRSMIMDAEKYTGAVFAEENDPRITKIGRLMRATRVDEIPQFFNVLKGEMSVVGPRPERPIFVKQFSEEIPEYRNRLAVKPGITGLAQVMGNYTTTAENKAKFDLMYIRNYSIFLDLKILIKTVKVVFSKEQAEGFKQQECEINEEDMTLNELLNSTIDQTSKAKWLVGMRRTIGIVVGCLLLVVGSIFFRYSSLAVAMVEAIAQQDSSVTMSDNETANEEHITDSQRNKVDSVSLKTEENGDKATNFLKKSDIGSMAEEGVTAENGSITQSNDTGSNSNVQGTKISDSQGKVDNDTSTTSGNGQEVQQGGSNQTNSVALSEEQIEISLDKMTAKQKMQIAYQFLSRVDTKDLIQLEQMAQGGFTEEEKEEAKVMMHKYFDEKEEQMIRKVYLDVVQ